MCVVIIWQELDSYVNKFQPIKIYHKTAKACYVPFPRKLCAPRKNKLTLTSQNKFINIVWSKTLIFAKMISLIDIYFVLRETSVDLVKNLISMMKFWNEKGTF